MLNFCWPLITWVVFDEFSPVNIDMGKGCFCEFSYGVCLTCGNDKIVAFLVLQNSPHCFDVLGRVAPISFRIQVSQKQFMLQSMFNGRDGARDLASDESFAPPGAFMIEQNAVARAEPVAFAVIDRRPIRKHFCD